VNYRPSQIGAFEFAVVAALRAEQLRRGCVPKVEGDHKFVVTAQLEVIAGKVVRAVEGAVQNLPDAVAFTPLPAVLCHEAGRDPDVASTEALTSIGSSDVIGRREMS
jgi:DNA-directed RNA polymerase subunit K/omega